MHYPYLTRLLQITPNHVLVLVSENAYQQMEEIGTISRRLIGS